MARVPEISHTREIHICIWADSDRILITVGVEKIVKIWDYETKTLLCALASEEDVQTIKYNSLLKALFFGDSEGNLYRWDSIDFDVLRKSAASKPKLPKLN